MNAGMEQEATVGHTTTFPVQATQRAKAIYLYLWDNNTLLPSRWWPDSTSERIQSRMTLNKFENLRILKQNDSIPGLSLDKNVQALVVLRLTFRGYRYVVPIPTKIW